MRHRLGSLLIVLLFISQTQAQDIEYVKEQASFLSDAKMKGRGYVDDGLQKAAKHIVDEFRKMGLSPLRDDYLQAFEHKVNTFPGRVSVSVDRKKLQSGIDFILNPSCPSDRGRYRARVYHSSRLDELKDPIEFKEECKKCILVLDMSKEEEKEALQLGRAVFSKFSEETPVMWLGGKDLIWGVSDHQSNNPIIEMLPFNIKDGSRIKLRIESQLEPDFKSQNVLGYVEGTQFPDSFIVFSAHYDHLGMMGEEACFFGANDNASGTAYIMSLAKHYLKNPSKYSVAFMAFAGEEAGLLGSRYYVQNPSFPLENIKFLINLDLMGSGVEGITVVNAKENSSQLHLMEQINEQEDLLPVIKKRGQAANSDHFHFAEAGVPAVFIYALGGSKAYHDVEDVKENLTFAEYKDIFRLLTTLVERL